jgi:hypothetical protein
MGTIPFHPRSGRRRPTQKACELWCFLCDVLDRGEELWPAYSEEATDLLRELNLNNGSMIDVSETVGEMPRRYAFNPRAMQDWQDALGARLELEAMSGRRAPRPDE